MMEDKKSGIVVKVGETTQLEVAQFPSTVKRGPEVVAVNNFTRQFCQSYIQFA